MSPLAWIMFHNKNRALSVHFCYTFSMMGSTKGKTNTIVIYVFQDTYLQIIYVFQDTYL